MFKKQIWKPLLIGVAWVISLGGLVVLMSFIETKKAEVLCKAVKIFIPGSQYFIDRHEVESILQVNNDLIGHKMETINLHELQDKLKANPFIEYAKVYTDMDGEINVEISQRQPILRIINRYGQDFYVDQHGLKIPLSANFTARVIVANGNIDELFANHVDTLHAVIANQLFKTAEFIRKDSLWSAQIAQLFVNKEREIEMIPRVGNHRILLGDADSLNTKFRNLLVFYKKALPRVGWETYKTINIKYANQVIGVRDERVKKDSAIAKIVSPDTITAKKTIPLAKKNITIVKKKILPIKKK